MEIIKFHEELTKPYSEIAAFSLMEIEKAPEDYAFILTEEEFETFSHLYMEMGAASQAALMRKEQIKLSPEWERHGFICSVAALATALRVESSYVMGFLTPHALGKNCYIAFFVKKGDEERRTNNILRWIADFWGRDMEPKGGKG